MNVGVCACHSADPPLPSQIVRLPARRELPLKRIWRQASTHLPAPAVKVAYHSCRRVTLHASKGKMKSTSAPALTQSDLRRPSPNT